jgi:hypothetical protein
LRRLVAPGGPRGPCPAVLAHAGPEGLTVRACLDEAALQYHRPGDFPPGSVAFPADALTLFEGPDEAPVRLGEVEAGQGQASWPEAGLTRTAPFATLAPERLPPFPDLPPKLVCPGSGFLAALADAVQTAARDPARLAIMRLLLRGRGGEVVATDGRQLLVQGGFTFPWKEDVLVPALPAFSGKGPPSDGEVQVGRTASHVGIAAGPWTFLLAIDGEGRFPNYQEVIPRPHAGGTRVVIDPQDGALLLGALPRLPGKEGKHGPVTLELGEAVCVRARDEGGDQDSEVLLPRSRASGPEVSLVSDRLYLLRALKLGFGEVEVVSPDQPLVCRDDRRTFLWMPLSSTPAPPPARAALAASTEGRVPERMDPAPEAEPEPQTRPPEPRRRPTMPTPPPGGRPSRNGAPAPAPEPAATPGGIDELIEEAEALRGALAEVQARAGRLAAALRRQRRQGRALQAALASLRQLQPPVR